MRRYATENIEGKGENAGNSNGFYLFKRNQSVESAGVAFVKEGNIKNQ